VVAAPLRRTVAAIKATAVRGRVTIPGGDFFVSVINVSPQYCHARGKWNPRPVYDGAAFAA
jgi:hypothetical protein